MTENKRSSEEQETSRVSKTMERQGEGSHNSVEWKNKLSSSFMFQCLALYPRLQHNWAKALNHAGTLPAPPVVSLMPKALISSIHLQILYKGRKTENILKQDSLKSTI